MGENRENCVLCGSKIVHKYTTQMPVFMGTIQNIINYNNENYEFIKSNINSMLSDKLTSGNRDILTDLKYELKTVKDKHDLQMAERSMPCDILSKFKNIFVRKETKSLIDDKIANNDLVDEVNIAKSKIKVSKINLLDVVYKICFIIVKRKNGKKSSYIIETGKIGRNIKELCVVRSYSSKKYSYFCAPVKILIYHKTKILKMKPDDDDKDKKVKSD